MRWLLPGAFAALVLAGCASPSVEDGPSTGDLSHGSVPFPPDGVDGKGAGASDAAGEGVVLEQVEFAGDTGLSVCVVPAGFPCVFESADLTRQSLDASNTYASPREGRLAGGQLTVSWSAATPLTQNLRAMAGALSGCPENCAIEAPVAEATGPSPLVLDVPATKGSALYGVQVFAAPPHAAAEPFVLGAGQPFTLAGTLAFAA